MRIYPQPGVFKVLESNKSDTDYFRIAPSQLSKLYILILEDFFRNVVDDCYIDENQKDFFEFILGQPLDLDGERIPVDEFMIEEYIRQLKAYEAL